VKVIWLNINLPADKCICAICWRPFKPRPGHEAILTVSTGAILGSVCGDCLAGGEARMKERLTDRARTLRAEAWLLEHELERGIEIQKRATPVIMAKPLNVAQ